MHEHDQHDRTEPRGTHYEVVRQTWLTLKPAADSGFVATLSSALLALGSLVYLYDLGSLKNWMAASPEAVFGRQEYWRLWTTLFAHADLGHFVSNAFLFFILGFLLYGYFGSRLFPLAAFLWGGLINLLVLTTYPIDTRLIGASGVVYWLGGVWLVLYFFLSRQKNLSQRWLRTLGVSLMIFMPAETFAPNVSYRTHFVGFALGLMVGGWHFWRNRDRFRQAEVREVIHEEPDPAEQEPTLHDTRNEA